MLRQIGLDWHQIGQVLAFKDTFSAVLTKFEVISDKPACFAEPSDVTTQISAFLGCRIWPLIRSDWYQMGQVLKIRFTLC